MCACAHVRGYGLKAVEHGSEAGRPVPSTTGYQARLVQVVAGPDRPPRGGRRPVSISRQAQPIVKTLGFAPFFPVSGKRFTIAHPEFAALPQSGLPRLLREARLGKGLTKLAAAKRLGVCVDVVGQWERGEHAPRIRYHPAIIDFLGTDEWLEGRTLADRIRKCRARKGWTQAGFGQQIGVSERTITRWERGFAPTAAMCGRVERMLADLSEAQTRAGKSGDRARR